MKNTVLVHESIHTSTPGTVTLYTVRTVNVSTVNDCQTLNLDKETKGVDKHCTVAAVHSAPERRGSESGSPDQTVGDITGVGGTRDNGFCEERAGHGD